MNKRVLQIIGLIGGILAAVGVFLNWVAGVSGWDLARVWAPLLGASANYVYVILVGGILALIGGILALATKIKPSGYLLPVGGIVALLGWIWAAKDISDWSVVAYGFYTCLVGAILALVSSLSLREK